MDKIKTLSVEGIVSSRDKQPYITLFLNKDKIAQLSMNEARNFAHDIFNMCSRTEADAMIFKFFENQKFPREAAGALMFEFRLFRHELDSEQIETSIHTPSGDPPPN